MAQEIIGTQESQLLYSIQSAFGTAATTGFLSVATEGEPTIQTPSGEGNTPISIKTDRYAIEKPVVFKRAMDDAVEVTVAVRQADGADMPFVATAFGAAGCDLHSSETTTIGTYTSSSQVTLAAHTEEPEAGSISWVELSAGEYVPVQWFEYTAGTNVGTFRMALPSASEAGKAVVGCATVRPATGCAAVTNLNDGATNETGLLTLRHIVGACGSQWQDCAVTAVGDLTIEANGTPTISFTFGSSQGDETDEAMGASDTYCDSAPVAVVDDLYLNFAAASATAGIANASVKLIGATISFQVTAAQIPSMGDSSCVNNIQGWLSRMGDATVTLDMLYDEDRLDDFDGANGSKFIGLGRRVTAATDAGFAFFAPNAHQIGKPTVSYYGNNEVRVQVQYGCATPSGGDASPWALGIMNTYTTA